MSQSDETTYSATQLSETKECQITKINDQIFFKLNYLKAIFNTTFNLNVSEFLEFKDFINQFDLQE